MEKAIKKFVNEQIILQNLKNTYYQKSSGSLPKLVMGSF